MWEGLFRRSVVHPEVLFRVIRVNYRMLDGEIVVLVIAAGSFLFLGPHVRRTLTATLLRMTFFASEDCF